MKKEIKLKLKEGEKLHRFPNKPTIFINGTGKNMYLWVGNDGLEDKFCFATKSGAKILEKFAVNILKALKSKKLDPKII